MTPNSEYQELFERQKSLQDQRWQITKDLQAELEQLYLGEWKKLHPKTKKMPEKEKYMYGLPEANWKPHFERLKAVMDEKHKEIDAQIESEKKRRFVLCDQVEFSPADRDYEIGSCNGGSYGSQGFGANKYAEGTLLYKCELLKQNGFVARIDCIPGKPFKTAGSWGYSVQYNDYKLIANCEPWMFESLWLSKADLKAQDRFFWKNGVNAKVYNPYALDYGE